jgi:AraC-like DNA-binding protein
MMAGRPPGVLYDFDVSGARISAWQPRLDGVREVLHAHFTGHSYPMHAHDSWTLLIVDDGAVRYDLDRHERGAFGDLVTLLPPHVPHNGAPASPLGFRKRVLYLAPDRLPDHLIGASVDNSAFADRALRHRLSRLHHLIRDPAEALESESTLAYIVEALQARLGFPTLPERLDHTPAHRLRDLIEEHVVPGLSLAQASRTLHFSPAYLVRSFTRVFHMSPNQYLISRRVDLARRRILAGDSPAWAATTAGFYDQSHLTRHFKRILGVPPATFTGTTRRTSDPRQRC